MQAWPSTFLIYRQFKRIRLQPSNCQYQGILYARDTNKISWRGKQTHHRPTIIQRIRRVHTAPTNAQHRREANSGSFHATQQKQSLLVRPHTRKIMADPSSLKPSGCVAKLHTMSARRLPEKYASRARPISVLGVLGLRCGPH